MAQGGSRRLKEAQELSRMLKKAQEGSRWFKRAKEGIRRLKKAQEGLRRLKKVQERQRRKVSKRFKIYTCFLIDSRFSWVVNEEGYGMVALPTDWIVCSINVGASES